MECITGPISRIISTQGMPAVYEALDDEGKKIFEKVRTPELTCCSEARIESSWYKLESPFFWALRYEVDKLYLTNVNVDQVLASEWFASLRATSRS